MVLKAGDSLGARQRANKAQVDPKALKRGLEQCWWALDLGPCCGSLPRVPASSALGLIPGRQLSLPPQLLYL